MIFLSSDGKSQVGAGSEGSRAPVREAAAGPIRAAGQEGAGRNTAAATGVCF